MVSIPIPAFHAVHSVLMKFLKRFLLEESGQDLIEYTLLMAFIALASASIFINVGTSAKSIWKNASNQLSNAVLASS